MTDASQEGTLTKKRTDQLALRQLYVQLLHDWWAYSDAHPNKRIVPDSAPGESE